MLIQTKYANDQQQLHAKKTTSSLSRPLSSCLKQFYQSEPTECCSSALSMRSTRKLHSMHNTAFETSLLRINRAEYDYLTRMTRYIDKEEIDAKATLKETNNDPALPSIYAINSRAATFPKIITSKAKTFSFKTQKRYKFIHSAPTMPNNKAKTENEKIKTNEEPKKRCQSSIQCKIIDEDNKHNNDKDDEEEDECDVETDDEDDEESSLRVDDSSSESNFAPSPTPAPPPLPEETLDPPKSKSILRNQNQIKTKSMSYEKWFQVQKRRQVPVVKKRRSKAKNNTETSDTILKYQKQIDEMRAKKADNNRKHSVYDITTARRVKSVKELSDLNLIDNIKARIKSEVAENLKNKTKVQNRTNFNSIVDKVRQFLIQIEEFKVKEQEKQRNEKRHSNYYDYSYDDDDENKNTTPGLIKLYEYKIN